MKVKSSAGEKSLSLAYPFDWRGLEDFNYPLDDDGIPRVNTGKKYGLQYNPVTTAQYGLWNLQKYAASDRREDLQNAQNCVHWLVENFREWRRDIGAWVYDYDLPFYGPQAPWISGMAQGQGVSLLLRMYQLTSDKVLLGVTGSAFQAFLHPVAQGGVVASFPDGALVFEEFPTDPPSLVLNGHIFAMLGIYDYAKFRQDPRAQELFTVSVNGLKKNLERYDTGFWNLYDLHPTRRLASPMYLKVHVQLLTILADLSEENFFLEKAQKWRGYLNSPVCRLRWLYGKIAEKIRLRFWHAWP